MATQALAARAINRVRTKQAFLHMDYLCTSPAQAKETAMMAKTEMTQSDQEPVKLVAG